MTDSWLMGADCIHGVAWYECAECEKDDPRPPDEATVEDRGEQSEEWYQ